MAERFRATTETSEQNQAHADIQGSIDVEGSTQSTVPTAIFTDNVVYPGQPESDPVSGTAVVAEQDLDNVAEPSSEDVNRHISERRSQMATLVQNQCQKINDQFADIDITVKKINELQINLRFLATLCGENLAHIDVLHVYMNLFLRDGDHMLKKPSLMNSILTTGICTSLNPAALLKFDRLVGILNAEYHYYLFVLYIKSGEFVFIDPSKAIIEEETILALKSNLNDFSYVAVAHTLQTDNNNCGVFVCQTMFHSLCRTCVVCLDARHPNGMTPEYRSLNKFPRDEPLRNEWKMALQRGRFEPSERSRVCCSHFLSSDYMETESGKRLHPNAVPSIFFYTQLSLASNAEIHNQAVMRLREREKDNLQIRLTVVVQTTDRILLTVNTERLATLDNENCPDEQIIHCYMRLNIGFGNYFLDVNIVNSILTTGTLGKFPELAAAALMRHSCLIGPFNVNNHWCLFGLWPSRRKFIFIDPKVKMGELQWWTYKMNLKKFFNEDFSFVDVNHTVLRVDDNVNCGVLVCQFMKMLITQPDPWPVQPLICDNSREGLRDYRNTMKREILAHAEFHQQ